MKLANKKILVTRPEAQASCLCELIRKNGGDAIRFPVIEIKAKFTVSLKDKFKKINNYDLVIYISQNAVTIAFEYFLADIDISLIKIQIAAIGETTARTLHKFGIEKILYAGEQADSEALLALPEFATKNINGKRVLIVRGTGGREILSDTLQSRGAKTEYIEIYQRCLPEYGMNDKRKVWQDHGPDAIIITSNNSLKNLLALTMEEDMEKLFKTPLVLMSERISEYAKRAGFSATMKVADKKSDEGLLAALIDVFGD